MPAQTKILVRRDTAANWSSINPVLDSGEFGYATDTLVLKVGDGLTSWNNLPIEAQAGSGKMISPFNDSGAYLSGSGLVLSSLANNYASAPDSAALSITGDIDIKAKIALTDWTPSATTQIVTKHNGTSQISFYFEVQTPGNLRLSWSVDGTNVLSAQSTVATGVSDGSTKWIRATMDVNDGAGNRVVKFYTSDDGATWAQLGATVTQAGVTSIFDSTAAVAVGWNGNSGAVFTGTFYRAIIQSAYDTADNTSNTVFDANFETATADAVAFTGTSNTGIKSDGLVLVGRTGEYASAPDSAALSITGDIDIRVDCLATDWTPSSVIYLIAKYGSVGQRSYFMRLNSDGTLGFTWSNDGTNTITTTSAALGFSDGARRWVRVTLDVDNGSGGWTAVFYTSTDGTTWTTLTTNGLAGTTSIFDSTAAQEVGSFAIGTSPWVGTIYRAQVLNGIGGTTVFDADFDAQTPETVSFTESSSNAATVTVIGTNPLVTINTTRYLLGVPGQQPTGVSTLGVGADTDYFAPFFVSCPILIDMHAFEVTTGPTVAATFRSVIYRADNNLQPTGAPVVDFGVMPVAASATGTMRAQVTPVLLQPGYYLSTFNCSAAMTLRRVQAGITDMSPTLSSSPIAILRSRPRTHGVFPSLSSGWNSKTFSSNPVYYFVFYRWRLA